MIKPGRSGARRALALIGAGALLTAPLALISGGGAGAATIAGARSLSDPMAVTFAQVPASRTTDLHVLAWNDFHGNLEPGSLNLYGQYAGGAAYLAKLVEDRQRLYGRNQATVMAGDAIGASPLANALFHEEPAIVVDNLEYENELAPAIELLATKGYRRLDFWGIAPGGLRLSDTAIFYKVGNSLGI